MSAVKLHEDVVIPAKAYEEARACMGEFLRHHVPIVVKRDKASATGKGRICPVEDKIIEGKLELFVDTVTLSLWPEDISIARGKQKLFNRPFNKKLFGAIDGEFIIYVSAFSYVRRCLSISRPWTILRMLRAAYSFRCYF